MWNIRPIRAASHYGTVNPDIMKGFGNDDGAASGQHSAQESVSITSTAANTEAISTSRNQRPDINNLGDKFKDKSSVRPQNANDFGNDVASGQSTNPAGVKVSNPYLAAIEERNTTMTQSYLRQVDFSERRRCEDKFGDFSFGRRYQVDVDARDLLVTNKRIPADFRNCQSNRHECIVCAEKQDVEMFPRFSVTSACTHKPNTCFDCIANSIRSNMASKLWSDIRCPECQEFLDYADVQRYADEATFQRYETLALKAAMSESDNFHWCTSGCGFGQVHDAGQEQPIVTCLHCRHRSCFKHNVAWHENLTCEEYDQFLADPENLHLSSEVENEGRGCAQKVLSKAKGQRKGVMDGTRNNLKQREKERRAMQERGDRRRAHQTLALKLKIAMRKKQEEEQSKVLLTQTTKPCPGCGWAIEKNKGCSHMTCIKCRFQFCWDCHRKWSRCRNSCNGNNSVLRG